MRRGGDSRGVVWRLGLVLLAGLCAWPAGAELPVQPEPATGLQTQPAAWLARQAVSAAHPLAAEAGARMLRDGGSAVDAAIAAQLVLGLVEPQSSGLGGGGFLLLWDGRQVQAWDGRETAPAAATERLFLRPDGSALSLAEAIPGGRSVGVPGVLRMLEAVHRQHGRLAWARLFEPAIELASQGYPVGPRLQALLAGSRVLRRDPAARTFFYQPAVGDGEPQPWPVGHRLVNPAMAAMLRQMAQRGADAFYNGPMAAAMAARVQSHPDNPGGLTVADLAAYRPAQREPLCQVWRLRWRVCGMGPPSSGGLAVQQILGLLDALPPPRPGLGSVVGLHRYAEASRLAFADRDLYLADPDFTHPPAGDWRSLLAPAYLQQRARLIGARAAAGPVPAGQPGALTSAYAPQAEQPEHGTSHLSVVDARGQAVSFTTSIEAAFGSGLLVDGGTGLSGGFLLNNQLTDFSFLPQGADGRPVANRVQPGKRPRSSMSPTLVFAEPSGELEMVLGSPGGPVIIHYVARLLLATLGEGQDVQAAVEAPNFGNFNSPTVLEAGRFPADTVQALQQLGHRIVQTELTSGLQVLRRTRGGWAAASDPRREGATRGD